MRIANKVNFKKSSCQDVFTQIHAGDCSFFMVKRFLANFCTFFLYGYQNSDILKIGHTFDKLKFDN